MAARDAVITAGLLGALGFLMNGQHWVLALIALLLTGRWVLVCTAMDNPKDDAFPGYRDELRTAGFLASYRLLLGRWFLDPLTRLIGDAGELSQHRASGWLVRNFGFQPWTAGSYQTLLLLAVVYPLLALMAVWIAGHEGRIGGWVLLPAGEPWQRLLLPLAFVAMVFGGFQAGCARGPWRLGWVSVYLGAAAVAVPVATAVGGPGAVAVAIAGAGAGAFVFFFLGAFTSAVAVVGAVAGGSLGAVFGVALTGTGTVTVTVTSAATAAAAVAGAAAALAVVGWQINRSAGNGRRMAIWLGFALAVFAFLAGATLWVLPAADQFQREISAMLLVFLTLLPLLNVIWDWLSLGLSRGLLSGIRLDLHRGWTQLAWALADIAFGFLFLLGLVAMTTAAAAAMNLLYHWGGGAGLLIDLPQYFADLRAAPDHPRFWWLYFMFLSTLIPTVLHLLIAGAAGTQWLAAHWLGFGAWRERMANSMATHSVHRLYAQIYLTIIPMLGLVVPLGLLWLLYGALTLHGGVAGFALLDGAEGIARFVMGDIFPAQLPAPDPQLLDQTPAAQSPDAAP